MADSNMRAAIAEALASQSEGTGEEPETTDDEAAATTDAQVEESTEDQANEAESSESEDEADEAPVTDDDTPTEYFGVDLSGLSAEERAAIVAGFQERDKFIQQLLRNKADEPAEETQDEAPSDDTVTDADLLKALGLDDPDDAYAEQTAKVALPLAKLVLNLQEQVTGLQQQTAMEATGRYWESTLTELENQFGKLPVSHVEVMKQAAEAGVAEPVDAFWRIMGPARQAVMAEVQKRREALVKPLKQAAKGAVRPKDETEGSEKVIDAKDVKDATRQALTSLFKERGIALSDVE